MKAYKVLMEEYGIYHSKVSEGIPVTFKNKPKPHIIIWDSNDDGGGFPFIEIATEGWDEKNPPTKIKNVEVVQKSEGYVIKPSSDLIINDDDSLVFWRFTSLRGGDVKIYDDILKEHQYIVLGTWSSSFVYDAIKIAGILAVLPSEQSLLAVTTDKYKNETAWKLFWNGNRIVLTNKELKSRRNIVKRHK